MFDTPEDFQAKHGINKVKAARKTYIEALLFTLNSLHPELDTSELKIITNLKDGEDDLIEYEYTPKRVVRDPSIKKSLSLSARGGYK